jgi:transcriptional regulator with XRE-family HTH domain
MTIGERISELRKQQNISQVQLAQTLNVTRQAVSKWENDLAVPDALKMIHLADLLDTDIEYLSTGRRNFSRRPPVVLTETKVVEKVIEIPVIQEKVIEKQIEVPVVEIVEKPIIKPIYRVKYRRNPLELLIVAIVCFFVGLLLGTLI